MKMKGDPDVVRCFAVTLKTPGILKMNDFVPEPEGMTDTNTLLDWRRIHWGTKWDICDSQDECPSENWDKLSFYFKTAWSPPQPFVAQISKLYPELEFSLSYYEPMMQFAGFMKYRNGYNKEDIHISWENNNEYKNKYNSASEEHTMAWDHPDAFDEDTDEEESNYESEAESTSTEAD